MSRPGSKNYLGMANSSMIPIHFSFQAEEYTDKVIDDTNSLFFSDKRIHRQIN